MVPSSLNCILLLSIFTSIEGIDSGSNNITRIPSTEKQGPRTNKRQVKLYSGVRPVPIVCNDEGFQEDPIDCSIFHRCVRSGKGRFLSFRFQCSPGTIYDPETEICNHPEKTRRVACGGKNNRSIKETNQNEINQEIPSPISTRNPIYFEKNQDENSLTFKRSTILVEHAKADPKSPWEYKSQRKETSISPLRSTRATASVAPLTSLRPTTPRSIFFNNQWSTPKSGEMCTADGFMGDSENCRKFYRCVGNQRGGFIRYEFLCSEPTIWDEDKGGCNHVWNVKRRRCGRGNIIFENDIKSGVETHGISKTNESANKMPITTQTQTQINYGSKVTQKQTQISNGTVNQNQTQVNYASGQTKQNQTQISYGTAVSQSQSQINYGDNGSQTQLQIDHLNDSSQMQSQAAESTTLTTTTARSITSNKPQDVSSTTKNTPTGNECIESGFMGDKDDCKKFYRCVDNGRGSYTRYEFSCGEGTVWDPNLDSCNHVWAVKGCGGKGSTETTSQHTTQSSSTTSASSLTSTTSTTQNYYLPQEPITEEENEISYGNQQMSSTTSKPISQMTTVPSLPTNDNQCKSSGFTGDNNDCKKFYRCVDDGNGRYTRYEFSCGEGTVWDSKIEACNHAWAVEKCGGNQNNNNIEYNEPTTTKATQVTQSSSPSTPQSSQQNDENDTGYGPQQDESTSSGTIITLTTVTTTEITTTSTTTEVSYNKDNSTQNVCTTSGFIGDSKDCKKFYRCVDNGNGAYTKYEFTCGEGTVWDTKNQVCNHAWAVESCGASAINEITETTSQKETENTILASTTTTQISVTDDEEDIGYGEQSNVTPSSSTTQSQHLDSNQCTSSGFMGDSNDCKKFYRCVDNGNGGFTKYEFTCGEGTVWDSELEACNHAWAVENCGGSGTANRPETTTQVQQTSNDQDNLGGYPAQNDEYTEKPVQSSTSSISTSTASNTDENSKCEKSGFMGDAKDCKQFYRCVDDGQGSFTQYKFTCGEGTAWDQSIESCNHISAVSKCNQIGNNNTNNIESVPTTEGSIVSEDQGNNNQQSTEGSFTSTSSTSKPSGGICNQEGFYGDEKNCKKFYRCVDNGQGAYTKYDFTCGEGTVWNQDIQACDHESSDNGCKSVTTSSTKKPEHQNDDYTESTSESMPTTLAEPNNKPGVIQSSDDKCEDEGFYGDSKNCKKFYRCVDNGKGGYTKYEFTCGEGTVWVQEIQACDHDNGIQSCATTLTSQPSDQAQSTTQSTSQSQITDKENGENTTESPTKPSSGVCTSEGFYVNENDCTKFYRCVDNGQGGFTKYEFTCGEGTAWDSDIQTCNHISEVNNCQSSNQQNNQIMHDEEISQTTESTSTTKGSSASSESSSSTEEVCRQEGFYGNSKDCTKFYRCVDNGKGGFIKYDFDCGEGTIWDQDLTTCNHPQDVANPSCRNSDGGSSTTESSMSQTTSNNENQNTSCSQESSSKKPENQNIKCEKAGFYADPNDCKKFYRCVDWDGNGQKFSVYHFECGEGTLWDPQLDTCNHEDSVYPLRNCSGSQSQGEATNQGTTTTETTISEENTSSSTEMTSTLTTTQESTSSELTTQENTTTEQSIFTTQSTTSEQTTSESTTTSTEPTTEQSNNEPTTSSQQTTQETTTSAQTTQSSEQTTTQQFTTSEITTQESATSETTTHQPTTSEQTTTQHSITEQTTTEQSTDSESTTTEQYTTEQQMTTTEQTPSTTEETEQTTTEQPTSENQSTVTTESTTQSTTAMTEVDGTTTTESVQETTTEATLNKECPDTEDDQYLYVCPTSFKRHPKYCNMFYQCTEDDESHETKIAAFTCPNNTIYDEGKIQCVEEDKADKKCDGQKARRHRLKRLNSYSKDPIQVDQDSHRCTTAGYHPFEKKNECSIVFLKCSKAKSGKLRGFVYQCPEGYVFWSISKKCEKRDIMKYCQESSNNNWNDRWEIPVERKNIAK